MRAAKVGLAVLLVLVMLGSVVSPAMAAAPDTVSQKEVRTVADKFIKKISRTDSFKDWRSARIGRIIPAYDVNENITAYIIELVKDENYAGYVVVSAKKTNYPILEFSKGKSPLMRARELGIKSEKIYRIGGLEYFVGSGGKYYDLSNGKETDLKKIRENIRKLMENERVRRHVAERAVEAEVQWKKYGGEMERFAGTLSWYGIHIYDVPAFYWDDGCAPTAAAMVLEYWGEHGYTNLDLPDWWYNEQTDTDNEYYSTNKFDDPPNEHTDLTEELHYAMGTSNDGTTYPWNIAPGINQVLNDHGYSNWASTDYWLSWSDVTNEIGANRPFVLAMLWGGTGSGHIDPYGNHVVAVVGYAVDIDTNEKFILLHDTWDYDVHYLAFGDWWGAWAIWVRPG